MSIEQALFSVLSQNAGVISAFSGRVYADKVPEGVAMPFAVTSLVDSVPIHGVRQQTSWSRARVQIDIYARGKSEIISAAEAIKTALRRYRGTVGSVIIDDCMLDSEQGDYSTEADTRMVSLDFLTYFSE
jgi:hypothetical protein